VFSGGRKLGVAAVVLVPARAGWVIRPVECRRRVGVRRLAAVADFQPGHRLGLLGRPRTEIRHLVAPLVAMHTRARFPLPGSWTPLKTSQ
jgi:hypothetical protein